MSKIEFLKVEDIHWQALKKGDASAFEHIYRSHIQLLYRYGMSFGAGDDVVTDAIQDVFTHIWHKRSHLGSTDNVKFYLLKSLKNRLFRVASVSNRFEMLGENSDSVCDDYSQDCFEYDRDEQVIEQNLSFFLTELPARQQEIVRLRFYENLSHQQIAELLQMNIQSAKNLLHRAIESLRRKILV